MKITLTGSLGNISKPLTEILVRAGHNVTVISSSNEKAAAIEALGARAAIGSINDADFLTSAFTGADVVYTMVPPNFAAPDLRKYMNAAGQNYADAIKAAGVKKVVNLSSIGAHLPGGTGPIAGLHDVEGILNSLDGVLVKHLRPAFFFVNFYNDMGMIRNAGIMGANYGPETPMVMVHPNDIAAAAAEELQQPFEQNTVRYIASDERKAGEVATALGTAIGKPDLGWVAFTDEQALNGMQEAGLPGEMARNYVEMGVATRDGKLWEDYDNNRPAHGSTKLEQFAREFAARFNA